MTQPSTPAPKLGPNGQPFRVLVLDDELNMQRLMKVILESEGYQVIITDDGHAALEQLGKVPFDLVVQDLRMPKMDGLKFLGQVRDKFPDVLSIVVTAFGTWETAVEAMRLGAYTHLSKPFDTSQFRQLVARALERKAMRTTSASQRNFPMLDIVGFSAAVNAVSMMVKRIAPTDTTVLITGESGTGKELVARAIHYHSLRCNGPFLPVNCGAFTETLLESELFGHAKGAFTHAIADRKGLFESATQGTLFLDEIGEMSLVMQVKLLRVLESQTFRAVGSNRETKVDVRIIAATNRNLSQMCVEGGFREDLYHRLNVIPMVLPPLRERLEDVPMLAGHFLARYSKKMGKPVTSINEDAMRLLVGHNWPGNIRELENTIERAVALCAGEKLTAEDVVVQRTSSTPSPSIQPPSVSSLPRPMGNQLSRGSGGHPSPFAANLANGSPFSPPSAPAYGTASPTRLSAQPGVGLPSTTPAEVSGSLPVPARPDFAPTIPEGGIDLERYLLEVERGYILQALERTDWNMTEAAKLLGMTFRSIRYRVSKLNIERPPR